MKCVTVIATIKVKPEQVNFMIFQLCRLVKPTRNETGNIYYGFYQNESDHTLFHSFENWSSKADVEKHLESCHIKRYFRETAEAVEVFDIQYFYKIC